jgi:hypothetical protein
MWLAIFLNGTHAAGNPSLKTDTLVGIITASIVSVCPLPKALVSSPGKPSLGCCLLTVASPNRIGFVEPTPPELVLRDSSNLG